MIKACVSRDTDYDDREFHTYIDDIAHNNAHADVKLVTQIAMSFFIKELK